MHLKKPLKEKFFYGHKRRFVPRMKKLLAFVTG